MSRWASVLALLLGLGVVSQTAMAGTSTVVLAVDGMT
jgi:hypothetical protein